ncbi:hypothetical protein ACOME3_009574 [Neoechinorhynchus agilis]
MRLVHDVSSPGFRKNDLTAPQLMIFMLYEKRDLVTNISGQRSFEHHLSQENSETEKEFDEILSKESFAKMVIIGQFNRGFILTRINKDLFIIDQHAADECYRYQKLITSFGIGSDNEKNLTKRYIQKLINPIKLDLTATAEATFMLYSEEFQKLGFRTSIDLTKPIGIRVCLEAVPCVSGFHFAVDDLLELICNAREMGLPDEFKSELQKREAMVCSSMVKLFASKACRSSFMIGTVLNLNQMKRIIVQLSETDKPWQCAHGRPTLRHLMKF